MEHGFRTAVTISASTTTCRYESTEVRSMITPDRCLMTRVQRLVCSTNAIIQIIIEIQDSYSFGKAASSYIWIPTLEPPYTCIDEASSDPHFYQTRVLNSVHECAEIYRVGLRHICDHHYEFRIRCHVCSQSLMYSSVSTGPSRGKSPHSSIYLPQMATPLP